MQANSEWAAELELLRKVLRDSEMEETVKWGIPTYTVNGKNVAGLGAFKSHVAVWFFQGSFLTDKHNKLINAQEGKTKGMRQWRFNNSGDIDPKMLAEYVEEAVANQKAGREIKVARNIEVVVPPELQQALDDDASLGKSFAGLTPGRQREYAAYIDDAKRATTKLSRLEKIRPMIESGVGLNDKYRNC